MEFNTTDNTFGQFPGLGAFYLRQLHNYPHINYANDNLTHRQMLAKPDLKFGNTSYIDNTDLTESLLPEKSKSLKALVDVINKEVDDRLVMKEEIFSGIDTGILKCDNYLLETKNISTRYHPDLGRRRTSIEHEIFGLEKEKRMEETACWRDLVFLKKDLFASLKEYWAAAHREKFLSEDSYMGVL